MLHKADFSKVFYGPNSGP